MATAINWPFTTANGWPRDVVWLRDGYGLSRAKQHSELVTRRGRAVLRIGTTGPESFPASLALSGDELYTFRQWVQYTLAGGGKWFNAPVKTAVSVRTIEIRFLDISEQIELIGVDYWRVSASFETRAGTEGSYSEYAGMLDEDDLLIG